MSSRTDEIRSLFDTSGKGLEIGPSHAPLMAKNDGFDVDVLDYLDADGLRKKYAAAGVDVSRVEDVDYVGDGRSLPDVIGETERYNWIVASHVIEHVPDLVGFLQDCETLLKTGGVLVLAVPDKRCCFDILRPVSTIGQVLQAHIEGRKKPPPGAIFDDVAYARRRDGAIGWLPSASEPLTENVTLSSSFDAFAHASKSDEYIDVHCWVFVPSSFRLIVAGLNSCGVSHLREQTFQRSGGEFYAVLVKDGAPSESLNLGDLAVRASMEEREANIRV